MYINKNLQEIAYDYLMEKIMNEELSNDEIYSEEKIAQELGISRSPVRAALQRLNHDNYIDIIPYKGFKLHEVTMNDIIQTYQLRCAMEGYCCRYIARKHNTKEGVAVINQLKKILAELSNIYEKHKIILNSGEQCEKKEEIKINEFLEADLQFHKTIVEFADNEVFNSTFNSYVNTIRFLARSYYKSVMHRTIEEHRNIVEALEKGDEIGSFNSLEKHMGTPTGLYLERFNTNLDI
ncbi:MAG TPA: GntR family transcriptional regulator [Tissierellia bacterium]|nr:GntR family transcriptional regulator [Tissierellia bacterium]